MTNRTRDILFASVASFIARGAPVTSERLFGAYDFGIKPAMIRWELQDLADSGYLYQTHPSGGRLPTDRAYRFFVGELASRGALDTAPRRAQDFAGAFSRGRAQSFVDDVAGYLGLLGVGYDTESESVYESGLHCLLTNLDVADRGELLQVVNDFEELPERIAARRSWWRAGTEWPRVFIGENPLTTSEHLAVLAGRFAHRGGEFLLVAVGPKRMDYRKSLTLFRALEQSLDQS